MKATTLTLSLLVVALGAGCASTGPNTRQGAGIGAVAGGVIGGIVGHQSGEAAAGAAIGAAAGGAAGAAVGHRTDRERGTLPTAADRGYTVVEPPPTPTSQPPETVPPRPSREAVWIGGYWSYTGNPNSPYEWVAGHWEVPPPGRRTWVPGGWQRSGGGYVYTRGSWQ